MKRIVIHFPGHNKLTNYCISVILHLEVTHMQQTVILSSRGQLTLPASLRKRFGLKSGGAVIIEECGNSLILKPAAVLEIEMYTDDRIAAWNAEDLLTDEERSSLLARHTPVP